MQFFANAFYPCVAPEQEKRYVCAQRQADVLQLRGRQTGAPQLIKSHEYRGRIRRAAAHACLHGNAFAQVNVRAVAAACCLLQGAGGAGAQVVGR